DPVALSMAADDRHRPLLPVAGIYGPNASGKSNVLAALDWLRDAVANSLRQWGDTIPIDPFVFVDDSNQPSRFTFESVLDGVRFEYVLDLDRTSVHYEALFHYPEKKRRRIFEREGQELKLQRGLSRLSGTRRLLTPRSLALTIARRFDEQPIMAFADELRGMHAIGRGSRWNTATLLRSYTPGESTSEQWRAEIVALLRMADLGIDDVVVDDDTLFLLHRTASGLARLSYEQESAGTRTWFELIGLVLMALHQGTVLLFDGLDATLHPVLSRQLIRLFADPTTNPTGAQLIFTAHDPSLLNHLDRDEVWLTEKVDGVTRLGSLAEFAGERVRKSQNLEKAYLDGRFGALPHVDRTLVVLNRPGEN
ncbi:MAG TPA: ATP-binding protein, partial [Pseudonocardiaceae bacterium]|nr:ATP-binding protein [Pseudonocardiaceae bacterium]